MSLDGLSFSDEGPIKYTPGQIRISVDAERIGFVRKLLDLHEEQQRRAAAKKVLDTPLDPFLVGIDPTVLTQWDTEREEGDE